MLLHTTLRPGLLCAKNRERTGVSLVYFNQLAASTLVRRYTGRIKFLHIKNTLVRYFTHRVNRALVIS